MRTRKRKDDYVTPSIIFTGMALSVFYLCMRWQNNRITNDEIITISVALGIAFICFICYLPAAQRLFDRMEHERKNAEQRRFWARREASERAARLKVEQVQRERQERAQRRLAMAMRHED